MPIINGYGHGPFTQKKLLDFDGLMRDYLKIVKAIQNKYKNKHWADNKFHYLDMNAGPGIIAGLEPYVLDGSLGSPFAFIKYAELYQLNYQADMIEHNKSSYEILINNLADSGLLNNCNAWHDDHHLIVKQVTPGTVKWKWGLAYHDPNNGQVNFEILKYLSVCRPTYDILINMPGALFKRSPSHYNDEILLSDHMDKMNKELWFIKDLLLGDKHQWTFLLGTNMRDMKEYTDIGLLHVHKPKGKRIFERVNWSKGQLKKKLGTQLMLNI